LSLLCLRPSVDVTIVFMVLAGGLVAFQLGGASSNIVDVAPNYAGVIGGLQNTAGTVPGIVAVILTGAILSASNNNWSIVFGLAACIYFSGFCFFVIFASGNKQVN